MASIDVDSASAAASVPSRPPWVDEILKDTETAADRAAEAARVKMVEEIKPFLERQNLFETKQLATEKTTEEHGSRIGRLETTMAPLQQAADKSPSPVRS